VLEIDSVGDEPKMKPVTKPRSWTWFLLGFLFVFVGAAALCPMPYFRGHDVLTTRLWQYYIANIRDWQLDGNLGPRTGNLAATILVFAMHIMGSTVAGIVAVAAVALCRRRSRSV
jgi:hypothetical protein